MGNKYLANDNEPSLSNHTDVKVLEEPDQHTMSQQSQLNSYDAIINDYSSTSNDEVEKEQAEQKCRTPKHKQEEKEDDITF